MEAMSTLGVSKEAKNQFDEFAAKWGKFDENVSDVILRMIKHIKECKR